MDQPPLTTGITGVLTNLAPPALFLSTSTVAPAAASASASPATFAPRPHRSRITNAFNDTIKELTSTAQDSVREMVMRGELTTPLTVEQIEEAEIDASLHAEAIASLKQRLSAKMKEHERIQTLIRHSKKKAQEEKEARLSQLRTQRAQLLRQQSEEAKKEAHLRFSISHAMSAPASAPVHRYFFRSYSSSEFTEMKENELTDSQRSYIARVLEMEKSVLPAYFNWYFKEQFDYTNAPTSDDRNAEAQTAIARDSAEADHPSAYLNTANP